jgi:amino acid adenylation domain-containing protein
MSETYKDIAQDIADLSGEQRELLELLLREGKVDASRLPITRLGGDVKSPPLSFAQQRLWFFEQLTPGTPIYNIFAGVRLRGALNAMTLRQCFAEVARRHEVLRATFKTVDGQPSQVIEADAPLDFRIVDLTGLPEAEREPQARRLAARESQRPCDLARGPLLRVVLLRCDEREHILLLTMHHIVGDAWSLGILVEEVAALYDAFNEGRLSPLAELPIQYADFAHWQRSWLQGEVLETQLAYWQRQLAGASPVLELPTDRPRPSVQRFRGSVKSFFLPAELTEGLTRLSRQQGGTLFMTMVAALQTLLHFYSGQEDISIGAPVVNRSRAELEKLIGFFVNTLVIRTDCSGDPSFIELLERVRRTVVDAQSHQDLPFEKLVEVLQPDRDLSHAPLFQVVLSLDNTPPPDALSLSSLSLSPFEIETRTARLDLHLTIVATTKGLAGSLEYNSDLFDPATIDRMIGHFRTLLEGIVADPSRKISSLPLLTDAERDQLLRQWNETQTKFPDDSCVQELFETRAAHVPDSVALISGDGHVSYSELNRRANQLAHYLLKLGVGPEVRVAVCMRRTPEMIVAILGVLKAGGAYVPLDPAYPQERLSFILEDSGAPLVLTEGDLLEDLLTSYAQKIYLDEEQAAIAEEAVENTVSGAVSDNLAYVIYTSGSTGLPKATLVGHKGLCNLVEAQIRAFDVRPDSRVLQFASPSFDASVSEIFKTLVAGAALILPDENSLLPGPEFVRQLREQAVTNITLPPSVLALLPPEEVPALRVVVAAGEECSAEVAARWAHGRLFLNAYGPTEATVCASIARCVGDDRRPTVGRPMENATLFLLDEHLRPVPIGMPGQVFIGGVGLARGYQGRADLTAERFIPHPFSESPGARLYKTGDLARYLPDGELDFLGRLDRQVKVRGYRIELGEVEAALSAHHSVSEAVVTILEDSPGNRRLVAYVVPSEAASYDADAARRHLQERLPEFMLPSEFVTLDAMPLTPNGKIDRRALPRPEPDGGGEDGSFAAPRTPLEEQLVKIWAEVLGVERIGIHDNFFELRGHSLSLIQVAFLVQETLGCELPLQIFFLAPTIAELSKEIETARQEG